MLDCLIDSEGDGPCLPIHTVAAGDYAEWLAARSEHVKAWLESIGFEGKAGRSALLPGGDGRLEGAVMIAGDPPSLWDFSRLQRNLPSGDWFLSAGLDGDERLQAVLGWALAGYRFDR